MLLLFLSIFFQYDLLHCEEKDSKNEFLDYSITEFWWNGTPEIHQTDRITPQYSFLPTPIGHGKLTGIMDSDLYPLPPDPTTPPEDLKTFYPFPNITRPSYPFDIKNSTVVKPSHPGPPPLPNPRHVQYPGLTPPPNFPPDYRYPTYDPYTQDPMYIPSPTGPTPKGPSFTVPEVDLPKFTFSSPRYYVESVPPSSTRRSKYSPFTWDSNVEKWQQGIGSYTTADGGTPTNVVPTLSQVFNYDYTTERLSQAIRRIPKTIQDAGSKLKSSVAENQTRQILREEITVIERNDARDLVFEDEVPLLDPDSKKTTEKNESNLLRDMKTLEMPAILKGELWQSNQTVTSTLTTVKEYLRQAPISPSYIEMIETLHEGYMMVFLLELTRLVATKERKAVHDVVKHADQIIYGFHQSGQLRWLGSPLVNVASKVARLLKKLDIDIIQTHAANLYDTLSQRHQELPAEMNTILEYADMLYEDDEGRLLFDALQEFSAYPNTSLTGYWLCNSLIHNFLRPYRRLKDTEQRQELMDSVNLLLKTRFSSSELTQESPIRHGNVRQAVSQPDETKQSSQKEPVAQTGPHSDTTRSPRHRKRKRHHRHHKKKREGMRYTDADLT